MFCGNNQIHSNYGNVEVIGNDGTRLILQLPEKDIKVSIAKTVARSVVSLDTQKFEMVNNKYHDVLSNHEYVREHRQEAEDRLKPYLAYLD